MLPQLLPLLQRLTTLRLTNVLLNGGQAWEYCLLALCVWREARGESWQGKLGVAWSIRNRVMRPGQTWWGDDWETVILKRWQYSSFNADDPNARLIPGDPTTDFSWAQCLSVAEDVYSNSVADPTNGATHYHAASMNPPPKWAETAQFKVQLGNHLFYIAA